MVGCEPGIDARPTIPWTEQTGAESYDLRALNPDGSVVYSVTGTEHRIATELRPGTYYVNVRANFPDGSRNHWTLGQQLVIDGRPVVRRHGNLVSWAPVQAATKYEIWVDQFDENGHQLVRQIAYSDNVTDLSYTPPPLGRGRYALWVRAIRSEGGTEYVSLWSRQLDFQVTAASSIESLTEELAPSVVLASLAPMVVPDSPVNATSDSDVPTPNGFTDDARNRKNESDHTHFDADLISTVLEAFCESGLTETHLPAR